MTPRLQGVRTRIRYSATDLSVPTMFTVCGPEVIWVPLHRRDLSVLQAALLLTTSRRDLWAVVS